MKGKTEGKIYNASSKFTNSKEYSKKRREQIILDRYRGAKIKKEFSKLCAKEGIESDRVHIGPREKISSNEVPVPERLKNREKKNVNPFEKELKIFNEKKVQLLVESEFKNKKKSEIDAAKLQRDERRKLFMKKTKKGQPIMNNKVTTLLNKIKLSK
jgi:hypothetical protein